MPTDRSNWKCTISLWLIASLLLTVAAWGKTFPATSDSIAAGQQRWGPTQVGYIADGCWHDDTSLTTSVSLPSCRAYALDTADPVALKGFEETTARTITYSGGDGTYWLAGRANPSVIPGGWTGVPGTHYAWILSATPPAPVSGVLVLGKVTVATNAITGFTIMAPWRRTTPYAVPAGDTLVFGVCPEAGPYRIFDANGITTGLIRLATGACGEVLSEWWGTDPTGLVDSTAAWNQTIGASAGVPPLGQSTIACSGHYRISSTAGNEAITLISRTQIIGVYAKRVNVSPTDFPACLFSYYGAGNAFESTDLGGSSHVDIVMKNITIEDVENTGEFGILCIFCSASTFENVIVDHFAIGARWHGPVYYGRMEQLKFRGQRTVCAQWTNNVNSTNIEAQCSSASTTMTHGFFVGGPPGFGGTSRDAKLHFLVEQEAGIPVALSAIRAIDATVYVETHAPLCSAYSTDGIVQLRGVEGGRLHVFLSHNCASGAIPIGLHLINNGGDPSNQNLIITGHINEMFTQTVVMDAESGSWGMNITGLELPNGVTPTLEEYTTGVMIGNNYMTHGTIPAGNQGRGSADTGSTWRQGDMIWQSVGTNPPRLSNILNIIDTTGNPPGDTFFIIPSIGAVTAIDGDATPTVKLEQLTLTRMVLNASATAITNLDDGTGGMCMTLIALGNRTVNNTETTIKLAGSANFAMNANDTLSLCLQNGIWLETARGDND